MAAMIWCPFPDRDHARSVAKTLLEENLIACANILGPMESLYNVGRRKPFRRGSWRDFQDV